LLIVDCVENQQASIYNRNNQSTIRIANLLFIGLTQSAIKTKKYDNKLENENLQIKIQQLSVRRNIPIFLVKAVQVALNFAHQCVAQIFREL